MHFTANPDKIREKYGRKTQGGRPPNARARRNNSLVFFDSDGALLTDFHAGLTAQTLFLVHGDRLAALQLVDLDRTDIHAFRRQIGRASCRERV